MPNTTRPISFSPVAALALGGLLAACDHPVRPTSGPTPRQATVAEALDVPVSFVQAFDRDGLQAPATAGPRPDPTTPEAQRLRRTLEVLVRVHSASERVKT